MAEKKRKPKSFTLRTVEKASASAADAASGSTIKKAQPLSSDEDAKTAQNRTQATSRKPRSANPTKNKKINLTRLPDETAQTRGDDLELLEPDQVDPAPAGGFTLGRVFRWSLGALLSLGIALTLDQFIRDLFARNEWLGWLGIGLTALFVLAALALIIREVAALWHLSSIHALRERAKEIDLAPDLNASKALQRELTDLFKNRTRMKEAVSRLNEDSDTVLDARDILLLTERHLMSQLDREAQVLIMGAAKRVSVVTAISPRAIADIVYVLYENLRLISRLSKLYGGKPGMAGFVRLAKNVLVHLGATGTIAMGDGLVQQMIGHGLSARLSARLGEGVLNGLLTARIGISAMDICRPMPFSALPRPGIRDFLSDLISFSGNEGTNNDSNRGAQKK